MEKIKEKDSEKRQELLNRLLKKEMNRMRLMCFKRKRRPLLNGAVDIAEANIKQTNKEVEEGIITNGQYWGQQDSNEIYHHHIIINSKVVDENIKRKKFTLFDEIAKTIRHELTHAFVQENLQRLSKIERINADCSPIFIECLLFFKCPTCSHKSNVAYNKKYGRSLNVKYDGWDWDTKMFPYILNLINDYNLATDKLNNVVVDNVHVYNNKYTFGNGETCGLEGLSTATTKIEDLDQFATLTINKFMLGSCISPTDIKPLTTRKILNGNFNNNFTKDINKKQIADMLYLQTRNI